MPTTFRTAGHLNERLADRTGMPIPTILCLARKPPTPHSPESGFPEYILGSGPLLADGPVQSGVRKVPAPMTQCVSIRRATDPAKEPGRLGKKLGAGAN